MTALHREIRDMLAAGHKLQDLLVNDGDDKWGCDCVTTPKLTAELVREWKADGQDCSDLAPLVSAAEWIKNNPEPSPTHK